jgi:hypothetical protein
MPFAATKRCERLATRMTGSGACGRFLGYKETICHFMARRRHAHAQVREAHPGMLAVPCRDHGAGVACPASDLSYPEDSKPDKGNKK